MYGILSVKANELSRMPMKLVYLIMHGCGEARSVLLIMAALMWLHAPIFQT